MDKIILTEVKKVIITSVSTDETLGFLTEDFPLVGNILDSMAVTNLILALEDHFDFFFDDEELSTEVFETVGSLAEFIDLKLKS